MTTAQTYEQQADAAQAAHDRAISYGAQATNPLSADDIRAREEIDYSKPPTVLGDPELAKITRLRLVSDYDFPWWDVSYCYGELRDGTPVQVDLGAYQIRKGGRGAVDKGYLIELAKRAGVFAKGLGLLDDATISTLQ